MSNYLDMLGMRLQKIKQDLIITVRLLTASSRNLEVFSGHMIDVARHIVPMPAGTAAVQNEEVKSLSCVLLRRIRPRRNEYA